MKYYTDYAKDHPRLNRIVHFSSRFVLAGLVFGSMYALQLMLIYRTTGGYRFSEEWAETGPSIFYSPLMLVAPIGAATVALLGPDVYRRVKRKSDLS